MVSLEQNNGNGALIDLASAYLFQARIAQRESGKKLVGTINVPQEKIDFIQAFARQITQSPREDIPLGEYRGLAEKILTKFEAICIRRKLHPVSEEMSRFCYQLLLKEFDTNLKHFPTAPARLAIATLHAVYPLHISLALPPIADFISTRPWLLNRAFTSYPADPVGFLQSGYARYQQFEQLPKAQRKLINEEARMRLSFAAEGGTVEDRVKTYLDKVNTLANDVQFKDFFASNRWVIEHAVSSYGKNAHRYLLTVKKSVEEMEHDQKFSAIADDRRTLLDAAIRRPYAASENLERALNQEVRITQLYVDSAEPSMPTKKLRDTCLFTPVKASKLEQELSSKKREQSERS